VLAQLLLVTIPAFNYLLPPSGDRIPVFKYAFDLLVSRKDIFRDLPGPWSDTLCHERFDPRLDKGDVEDWVDAGHRGWQIKLVSQLTNLFRRRSASYGGLCDSCGYRQQAAAGPQTWRQMPLKGFISDLHEVPLAAYFIYPLLSRALLRIR
jgi:hypothetical protein